MFDGSESLGIDPLLPNRRYSVRKIKANPFKVICTQIQKNLKIFFLITLSLISALIVMLTVSYIRFKLIEYKINKLQSQSLDTDETKKEIEDLDLKSSRFTLFLSYDVCKLINDQFFEDYMLIIVSFPLTLVIYLWNAFKCQIDHENFCQFGNLKLKRKNREKNLSSRDINNNEIEVVSREKLKTKKKSIKKRLSVQNFCYGCSVLSNYLGLNKLKKIFTCTSCGLMCSCSFSIPVPINPFSKRNRFVTAVIYAAYTYNILKIFEYLIVGDYQIQAAQKIVEQTKKILTEQNASLANMTMSKLQEISAKIENPSQLIKSMERGILMDLLKQICNVIIIGLRFYPVLLCVELKRKSKFCYLITTLYVIFLLVSYIYLNTFCLLSASAAIKEAKNQLKEDLNRNKFTIFNNYDNDLSSELRMMSDTENINAIMSEFKMINETVMSNNSYTTVLNLNSTRINGNFNYSPVNLLKNDILKVTPEILIKTEFLEKNLSLNKLSNDSTEFDLIKNTLFLNNIMYEKFFFYVVLCLITLNMIYELFALLKDSFVKIYMKLKKKQQEKSIVSQIDFGDEKFLRKMTKYDQEILYTRQIFFAKLPKPNSYGRNLFEKYIYKNRANFRFSKQFINTQIIAFILIYYITCIIIRKSKFIINMSSNLLILLVNFIFKTNSNEETSSFLINSKAQLNLLIQSLFDHISSDIVIACCLTSGIYLIQLYLGIRNYQRNVLNAYKGKYKNIPSPKSFSNTKLASSSLHYSGYAIGYLLWGYLILFEVIVVIIVVIKFLVKFYFITEDIAKILLPITTIFLFKRIIIWYLSRFFLTKKSQHRFLLRNHKLYFILNHFNFFFDCFLGSFVCFMRMAKSSVAALFFMPRLDYSIFGRFLERTDMGFISYVTFIHMEVNQTHPVKIAFCEILRLSLKNEKNDYRTNKRIRNKWLILYTLIKYPNLKRDRKKFILLKNQIPKSESFEQFFNRRVRNIFKYENKAKGQSNPCLDIESPRVSHKSENSEKIQSLPQVVRLNLNENDQLKLKKKFETIDKNSLN